MYEEIMHQLFESNYLILNTKVAMFTQPLRVDVKEYHTCVQ